MSIIKGSRKDETRIDHSHMEKQDIFFLEVSQSICKIKTNNQEATGFFMKLFINNEYFYFLMTNEHIITKDMIKNNESVIIYYAVGKKNIDIDLNIKERYINCFLDINKIDVTVVQILPKDDVYKDYFLLPNLDQYNNKELKNFPIFVPQYPLAKDLYNSIGIIKKINNDNEIIHLASTEEGASGSPIFLKDTSTVIGIHKKEDLDNQENIGDFIKPVLDIIEDDIKNKDIDKKIVYNNGNYYIGNVRNGLKHGKGKEFDKNGNIIYEGDFYLDKYEGKGKKIYESGNYTIGEFKDGLRNGKGIHYYKNGNIKYEGDFVNDTFEGEGKYIYEDNEYYIGEWKNGAKHGKGTFYYKNGDIQYEGDFINDEYDGYGKYIEENGDYYIGEFKKGTKSGQGILFNKYGQIKLEGIWFEDEFVGNS